MIIPTCGDDHCVLLKVMIASTGKQVAPCWRPTVADSGQQCPTVINSGHGYHALEKDSLTGSDR